MNDMHKTDDTDWRVAYLESQQRFVQDVVQRVQQHTEDMHWLDLESRNIWAALQSARSLGLHRDYVRGILSIQEYLHARGEYQTDLLNLRVVLRLTQRLADVESRIDALHYLGRCVSKLGNLVLAMRYLNQGLELANGRRDKPRQVVLQRAIGNLYYETGRFRQAKLAYEVSLRLDRKLHAHGPTSASLMRLGMVLRSLNDVAGALKYTQQSLARAREQGDESSLSSALTLMGILSGLRGLLPEAERDLNEALDVARSIGNQEQMLVASWNLANVYASRKDFAQAKALLERGVAITREIGYVNLRCGMLITLGVVVSSGENADMQSAMDYWREGLALARGSQNRERMSILLSNLATVHMQVGQYNEAKPYLDEALLLARSLNSAWELGAALIELGKYHIHFGRTNKAAPLFQQALRASQKADTVELEADAEFQLAKVAWARRQRAKAIQLAEHSLSLLLPQGYPMTAEVQTWLDEVRAG